MNREVSRRLAQWDVEECSLIHISVSATGFWVAECPLVVGVWLVPFSGGDSPLAVGLSVGS